MNRLLNESDGRANLCHAVIVQASISIQEIIVRDMMGKAAAE
jgi:hypothetical protein